MQGRPGKASNAQITFSMQFADCKWFGFNFQFIKDTRKRHNEFLGVRRM